MILFCGLVYNWIIQRMVVACQYKMLDISNSNGAPNRIRRGE